MRLAVVDEQVDRHPVGEPGDQQAPQAGECLVGLEGLAEHRGDLRDQRQAAGQVLQGVHLLGTFTAVVGQAGEQHRGALERGTVRHRRGGPGDLDQLAVTAQVPVAVRAPRTLEGQRFEQPAPGPGALTIRVPVHEVVEVLADHRVGGAVQQPFGGRVDRDDPAGGVDHGQRCPQMIDDLPPEARLGRPPPSLVSVVRHRTLPDRLRGSPQAPSRTGAPRTTTVPPCSRLWEPDRGRHDGVPAPTPPALGRCAIRGRTRRGTASVEAARACAAHMYRISGDASLHSIGWCTNLGPPGWRITCVRIHSKQHLARGGPAAFSGLLAAFAKLAVAEAVGRGAPWPSSPCDGGGEARGGCATSSNRAASRALPSGGTFPDAACAACTGWAA